MNARELHDHIAEYGLLVAITHYKGDDTATILRALDLLARVEESEDELVRELRANAELSGSKTVARLFDNSAATIVALKAHAEAMADAIQNGSENNKERTEHLEWRTKLANDLDECERMRDVLARTVNVLDAENKELRSAETVAWMICEPECKYGPTFGTENAAWSALTKAPPGSELVELVKRGK